MVSAYGRDTVDITAIMVDLRGCSPTAHVAGAVMVNFTATTTDRRSSTMMVAVNGTNMPSDTAAMIDPRISAPTVFKYGSNMAADIATMTCRQLYKPAANVNGTYMVNDIVIMIDLRGCSPTASVNGFDLGGGTVPAAGQHACSIPVNCSIAGTAMCTAVVLGGVRRATVMTCHADLFLQHHKTDFDMTGVTHTQDVATRHDSP